MQAIDRNIYADEWKADGNEDDVDDLSVYEIASGELKMSILNEWEKMMSTDRQKRLPCSVCGEGCTSENLVKRACCNVPLSLLVNRDLPVGVFPKGYNAEAYEYAIVHPGGLTNTSHAESMMLCRRCEVSLCEHREMPKYALANWLYYGYDCLPTDVRNGFAHSSPFERILIARARASKICFRFTKTASSPGSDESCMGSSGDSSSASRKYSRGNIVVMPQDAANLQTVLPPSRSELLDTVCAVFVGGEVPSRTTIMKLTPILVRKSRVRMLVEFLLKNNSDYKTDSSFIGLSDRNVDALLESESADEGVPACLEIRHLSKSEGIESASTGYTGRDLYEDPFGNSDVVMENVGYTMGEYSAKSYREMKMDALSHCLRGRPFVQSRAGSRPIPDFENPKLLTWLFPHLDPWGIGAFYHPARSKHLSMREQLCHLVRMYDSPFARDVDFAFVFYNILQKRSVVHDVHFKVPQRRYDDIVGGLLRVDIDVLHNLQRRMRDDAGYAPCDDEERRIWKVLSQVTMVGRGIPGTTAYKLSLRNEIRGLILHKGTPTLFLTVSPSDVHHPLMRLIGGQDVVLEDMMQGEDLDDWSRRVFAARNPAASAIFFHTIITAFIRVILRFKRGDRGLFG
ncbi:hypothetical protein BV22DRAFT_1023028, partial [Leucogyrophana mollusca]